VKNLVLVGGGHSHALALLLLVRKPIPGLNLTLISYPDDTPYSGMLPGHIAGFYTFRETHIALPPLADFAGAQFFRERAIGLDLERQQVLCEHHPPISFDYLSLDIGSTPDTSQVKGPHHAIAAKPVPIFLEAWQKIRTRARDFPESPLTISIIGGGAGGVELTLSMQSHLAKIGVKSLTFQLFHRSSHLLTPEQTWASDRLKKHLQAQGVQIYLQETVTEILPDRVICESGLRVNTDIIIWVTQASAPAWIKASGLSVDSRGFILVDDTLQTFSHPQIFATGDIATMKNHPRPKAGVFAVRQGPPLVENLRRICQNMPLKSYIPQKRYLSLIGTGGENAIATWGAWGWESPLLWKWKEYIDRGFMEQFDNLPYHR